MLLSLLSAFPLYWSMSIGPVPILIGESEALHCTCETPRLTNHFAGQFFKTGFPLEPKPLAVFDRTAVLIRHHFYDQTFRGLPWDQRVSHYRATLNEHSTDSEVSTTLNRLLEELHASHTEFLTSSDQEFWAIRSIFTGQIDGIPLNQIGAWFTMLNHEWFVRNVFEGSPAATAGLLPGDQIVSANGLPFLPVESFAQTDPVTLVIRRDRDGPLRTLTVNPIHESIQRTLLKATLKSFSVLEQAQMRVAYFHLWSGTHDDFKNALKAAALKANQECDAFILDLRDGFGGASPGFLDPFFDRDSRGNPIQPIYSKPLIVLINDGVRSGKEWITYILKQTKRATLFGTRTKGYFLLGSAFEIEPNRSLLYLAVKSDPTLPALENNGVWPDVEVQSELPFSRGKDPVLNAALKNRPPYFEERPVCLILPYKVCFTERAVGFAK